MGRKGFWPNRETLIALYKREGSAERVGKIYGVHPHTVRKYLTLYEYRLETGPLKGKRRWSAFADWLKENPEDALPPSVKEIHELTGVSKNSIKSYLWRRRLEAKAMIVRQPWKGGKTAMWKDINGSMIPDTAFSNVRSFVGITGSLKFIIRLKDGTPRVFYMTLKDFKNLYSK